MQGSQGSGSRAPWDNGATLSGGRARRGVIRGGVDWWARLAVLMLLGLPVCAEAQAIALPKTGQTTCYDSAGVIPCTGTGQDGDIRTGVAWPSPRFADSGDGTITDHLTGLVWLKDANCFGAQKWATALNLANTLHSGQCGLNDGSVPGDWHLPNANELGSLVYVGGEIKNDKWLENQGFLNVAYSWSSTSFADEKDGAWDVDLGFYGGDTIDEWKIDTGRLWPVRRAVLPPTVKLAQTGQTGCYDSRGAAIPCAGTGQDGDIRAGVAWPSPRFTDNGNGTITDHLTGLVWLRNARCFGDQDWASALNLANTLHSGQCGLTDGSAAGDWRLPNRNELMSLIHYGTADIDEWLMGQGFHNVSTEDYWSSTSFDRFSAWVVELYNGYVDTMGKSAPSEVLPVRTGGGASGTIVPDLTGTWLSLTQRCKGAGATQKCKLNGKVQVYNQGSQKAPSASFVQFYFSVDNVFDGGDLFLEQVTVGALKPGRAKSKKMKYKLPIGQTASGQYVIAVLDATGLIAEQDETNNALIFGPIP